jgi:putative addiction module component (TIGR02574 family)
VDERIKLVEDLWDSIAADQGALPITPDQKIELDRRLSAYAVAEESPVGSKSSVCGAVRQDLD